MTVYNLETESLVFHNEIPSYPLEYAENELFITGSPYEHMYLVKDWSTVKVITDPDTSNYKKMWAFLMP